MLWGWLAQNISLIIHIMCANLPVFEVWMQALVLVQPWHKNPSNPWGHHSLSCCFVCFSISVYFNYLGLFFCILLGEEYKKDNAKDIMQWNEGKDYLDSRRSLNKELQSKKLNLCSDTNRLKCFKNFKLLMLFMKCLSFKVGKQ